MVRAAYLAMNLTAWFVIVPLSLASPPTGLVMSLGTDWGLFRHYWVVAKLLISVLATILLLVHLQPVGHLAGVVARTTLARGELAGLRIQLIADAGAALVALLVATALSVYKPRGMTPYGRKQQELRTVSQRPYLDGDTGVGSGRGLTTSTPLWAYVFWLILILPVLLFVIRHLTGGGFGGQAP